MTIPRMKEFWDSLSDDHKLELMITYEEGSRLDAARDAQYLYVKTYNTESGFSPLRFLDVLREEFLTVQ